MEENPIATEVSAAKKPFRIAQPPKKLLLFLAAGVLVVALIVLLVMAITLAGQARRAKARLKKVEEKVAKIETDHLFEEFFKPKPGDVDLTTANIQDVNGDFKVCRLAVNQHLTGVKVTGRIVNATALSFSNTKFSITVDGKSKEFTTLSLGSGRSASFEVYIPDVSVKNTSRGTISFVESTVSYY